MGYTSIENTGRRCLHQRISLHGTVSVCQFELTTVQQIAKNILAAYNLKLYLHSAPRITQYSIWQTLMKGGGKRSSGIFAGKNIVVSPTRFESRLRRDLQLVLEA
jgi:hypothetical protein